VAILRAQWQARCRVDKLVWLPGVGEAVAASKCGFVKKPPTGGRVEIFAENTTRFLTRPQASVSFSTGCALFDHWGCGTTAAPIIFLPLDGVKLPF